MQTSSIFQGGGLRFLSIWVLKASRDGGLIEESSSPTTIWHVFNFVSIVHASPNPWLTLFPFTDSDLDRWEKLASTFSIAPHLVEWGEHQINGERVLLMFSCLIIVSRIWSNDQKRRAGRPPWACLSWITFYGVCHYLSGFPVVPVAIYAVIRAAVADDRCWVVPVERYEWVLNAPSLLSLVVSNER